MAVPDTVAGTPSAATAPRARPATTGRPRRGVLALPAPRRGCCSSRSSACRWSTNVYLSLTQWSGVGTPRWIGLGQLRRGCCTTSVFWASFRNTVAMIVAMVVVPTLLGLLLAAVLFDYIGQRFGAAYGVSVLRAGVLPAAGAAGRGGRHRLGLDPAPATARSTRSSTRSVSRAAPATGSATRTPRCRWSCWSWSGSRSATRSSFSWPALQRVDPEMYEAAEIDGAGWWRRFRAITIPQIRPETFVVALTCTIAALKVFGPIYALTRGGPENATNVPSYFAYYTFFKKLQRRLRRGHLHRAHPDHRRGGRGLHALQARSERRDRGH